MRHDDIMLMVDYMYWSTHRLLDHAERLTSEQFHAADAPTVRSLRDTMVHELDVEWSWRLRLSGREDEDQGELNPEEFPDLGTIRRRWEADEREMWAWLASLTDDDLNSPARAEGRDPSHTVADYLLHIIFHARQQQADMATLLTVQGQSPGELEFLEFLDSR